VIFLEPISNSSPEMRKSYCNYLPNYREYEIFNTTIVLINPMFV